MSVHRVLILGGAGVLGRRIAERLGERDCLALGRACDVTNALQVMTTVAKVKPEVVINCAAATNVDDCERHPEHAMAVNAIGAGHIAMAVAATDAHLFQISTDYVFRGDRRAKVGDVPYPINAYGYSKWLGEQAVRAVLPQQSTIVRLGWLYGTSYPNCAPMIAATKDIVSRSPVPMIFDDIKGNPTRVEDAASVIAFHVKRPSLFPPVVHLAPRDEPITWYDFLVKDYPKIARVGSRWRRDVSRPKSGGLWPSNGWEVAGYEKSLKWFRSSL